VTSNKFRQGNELALHQEQPTFLISNLVDSFNSFVEYLSLIISKQLLQSSDGIFFAFGKQFALVSQPSKLSGISSFRHCQVFEGELTYGGGELGG
jgi:hypothetical protein